jgi:hypothetical protein
LPDAGYSGKPLADKLGVKPGMTVVALGGPTDLNVAPLSRRLRPGVDMVLLFARRRADLERKWEPVTAAVGPRGVVWVGWPKKSSGVPTDMNEHVARDIVLPTGWVDVKVCAIDETWTGFKFVLRVALRG